MLRASVDRHRGRERIVVLGGQRVTYEQLWDRSARVAGGLRAAGVRPGDRVANRHGNSLEWCLGFWGTRMAGAVVVPVNTRFAESEVRYVVDDAGAEVVLHPDVPLPDGLQRAAVRVVAVRTSPPQPSGQGAGTGAVR
jgi:long-chain acyl-CoA synthetase